MAIMPVIVREEVQVPTPKNCYVTEKIQDPYINAWKCYTEKEWQTRQVEIQEEKNLAMQEGFDPIKFFAIYFFVCVGVGLFGLLLAIHFEEWKH